MRILVMSDSHGCINNMLYAADKESPDMILHTGDCISDCKDVTRMYPEIPLRSVRGNCDRGYKGLDIDEFVLEDKRFMMTHGHLFGVKMGLTNIKNAALERGVDILLFGHTHMQYYNVSDNIIMLNPGSVGVGTREYAILEIKNGVIECEHKKL